MLVDLFYSDFMSAHRTIHTQVRGRMMITTSLIIVAAILFGMTSPALFTKGMLTYSSSEDLKVIIVPRCIPNKKIAIFMISRT